MLMSVKVAVVIPFFQRKTGLLTTAIQSALSQSSGADLTIYVVDDASPISARSELAAELAFHGSRLRIIEQSNAGPGAARNAALDLLAPDTEFVAFLDSDDAWSADHLENAICALGSDFDLYFADFVRSDWDSSAFARCKKFCLADHRRLLAGKECYEFLGDMLTQILSGNVLGTSVTVYRFAKFPDLRYPTQLRQAGEDIVFWADLALRTKKIAFSVRCEARYGAGVNICYGARWGTPDFLKVTHDDIGASLMMRRTFALDLGQRALVRANLSRWRSDFTAGLLHDAMIRPGSTARMLLRHVQSDPMYALLFFPLAALTVSRWIRLKILPPG